MNAPQVRAASYRVLHALELLRAEIVNEKETDEKNAALDSLDVAEEKVRDVFSLIDPE
jgi:hypothetical protein